MRRRRPSPLPLHDRLFSLAWRLGLLVILLLTFLPFIFMMIGSIKDNFQFYHTFWAPAWPPHFENYSFAFAELKQYIWNSLFVTAFSISGIILFSTVAGFLFARYRFPGRDQIYYGMLAMMMVPGVLMLIPAFVWVQQLKLLDTYWVMILPYVAGGQVLGIYLMRGFFEQLEKDLFDSAQVDGAGLMRQLWHIAIPLSKPVIGIVAIVSALGVWNNFLWPLVTTSSEDVMVLTVGMLRYSARAGLYGRQFAGYIISAIPLTLMFIACTRVFMKGITSGALKG